MLGVFLLPTFTRKGLECQELLIPCDGVHVCTNQTSVNTLIRKSFGRNGVRTHVNYKGKNPLHRSVKGGSYLQCCVRQDSEPNTLPTELSPKRDRSVLFLWAFVESYRFIETSTAKSVFLWYRSKTKVHLFCKFRMTFTRTEGMYISSVSLE